VSRRIAIVATGGTIQNTPTARVPVEEVWQRIGGYAGDPPPDVELVVRDILRAGSETFGPAEWRTIAETVQQVADDGAIEAVIVTHGTFTAEETAYLLHLTVETDKPIVVVVSQRKHGTAGNDGDRNLIDAVKVALHPDAGQLGVVLVANEEIHSAREVTKENQRPGAFSSAPFGALGTVELDQATLYRTPLRAHTARSRLARTALDAIPRVDIVAAFAGADAAAIDAAVAAGTRAIVLQGFAYSGRGSDPQMSALERVAHRGIPVVLASRGRGGRIPSIANAWWVRADNLTAQKARVLVSVALAAGQGATLQELFDTH
jgi:L-asparaginase/Glu-tRNA(Gln) amidotransferase subunit D